MTTNTNPNADQMPPWMSAQIYKRETLDAEASTMDKIFRVVPGSSLQREKKAATLLIVGVPMGVMGLYFLAQQMPDSILPQWMQVMRDGIVSSAPFLLPVLLLGIMAVALKKKRVCYTGMRDGMLWTVFQESRQVFDPTLLRWEATRFVPKEVHQFKPPRWMDRQRHAVAEAGQGTILKGYLKNDQQPAVALAGIEYFPNAVQGKPVSKENLGTAYVFDAVVFRELVEALYARTEQAGMPSPALAMLLAT